MRTELYDALNGFILTVGILWGLFVLAFGFRSFFAAPLGYTPQQVRQTLVALIFGFVIVLPITIAAIWTPRISAALLLLSFTLSECAIFSGYGASGALAFAVPLGGPTLVLACGYAYVAHLRANSPPGHRA
jgi:hypothetical protein